MPYKHNIGCLTLRFSCQFKFRPLRFLHLIWYCYPDQSGNAIIGRATLRAHIRLVFMITPGYETKACNHGNSSGTTKQTEQDRDIQLSPC